jgi:hypothetical protein
LPTTKARNRSGPIVIETFELRNLETLKPCY